MEKIRKLPEGADNHTKLEFPSASIFAQMRNLHSIVYYIGFNPTRIAIFELQAEASLKCRRVFLVQCKREMHSKYTTPTKLLDFQPNLNLNIISNNSLKMKLAIASLLATTAAAFTTSSTRVASTTALNESTDDLKDLAKKLNPVVPYFDPLGLSTSNFWGTTQEETIGFIRESEVKHGRIAMFAFVGYIVHANGITWPWPMQLDGTPFPKVDSAPEAWDAIPDSAKLQIFAFIGFLEFVSFSSI